MRIKVYVRGTNVARFHARCRVVDGHLLWYGGSQFRMSDGWRCEPAQAAYLIMTGKSRIPAGMAAVRTCDRSKCVAHVGLRGLIEVGSEAGKKNALSLRKLTKEHVLIIRRWPNMRTMPPGKARTELFDALMELLPAGIPRRKVSAIKSKHSWTRIYKDAIP